MEQFIDMSRTSREQIAASFVTDNGRRFTSVLLNLFRSRDAYVRRGATILLGALAAEDASTIIPALSQALLDSDVNYPDETYDDNPEKDCFEEIIEALESCCQAGQLVEILVDALCQNHSVCAQITFSDHLDRITAAGYQVSDRVIATLSEQLPKCDHETRAYIMCALGGMGDRAVPALAAALADPDKVVRQNAAHELCRIGGPAVPALVAALADPDEAVQRTVIRMLHRIGEAAAAPLVTALSSPAVAIRRNAASALEGTDSGPAAPALVAALADPDEVVRKSAARALRKIGFRAIPALKEGMRRENAGVRHLAIKVLAKIDPESLADEVSGSEPAPLLSKEDRRILDWFETVDLAEYLTSLQVFWCIGCVERNAIESAGLGLGVNRLPSRLRDLDPRFHRQPLPTGAKYLGRALADVDGLFDRPPFHPHAWSDDERGLPLRDERGKRRDPLWTPKAWKAWQIVDRFLTLSNRRPEITVTDK